MRKDVFLYINILVMLSCLCVISGCATRLFTHYSFDLDRTRGLIRDSEDDMAIGELDKILRSSKDRLLRSLEKGMIYYLKGDFRRCIKEWLKAEEMIEEFERRPIISIREAGEGVGSLATNDYLITYQGMTYERVMLHIYLSLAYLMLADHDEARVELKKAEDFQRDALSRLRDNKPRVTKDYAVATQIESEILQSYDMRYGVSSSAQYSVSSDLNPLAFYLSGWLYKSQGYPDEALIDFMRIWDLGIRYGPVRDAIDDAKDALDSGGVSFKKMDEEREGEILILYQQGMIPMLTEFRIPVVINGNLLMVAIPVYDSVQIMEDRLHVRIGAYESETYGLINLFSLAKGSLRERAFGIALREAARLAFKASLSHDLSKEGGSLASIFSSLYNVLSEKADLRSWLTIPSIIHIGHMSVPPGRYAIDLYFENDGMHDTREIEIISGEYKILDIHKIGHRIIFHSS